MIKMKNLFPMMITLLIATAGLNAQTKYETSMQKAFDLFEEGKAMESIALFERIGQVEKDNWIPLYHAVNAMVYASFSMEDLDQRNAMLEKGKTLIAEAHKRSENNSELTTLEGFLYMGFVAMDPGTYGMTLSPKIMELHDKAVALDPKNPRAHLNKIEYDMGAARFFGKDLSPFCEQMKEIIPKFENQSTDIPFAPKHGLERAQQIANSCG